MSRLNKDEILKETNGGLKLFQLLVPELKMSYGRNESNVDSPISHGKKCFSVYEWNDNKYLFKDHYSKAHGDIFELVALMNKLNSKRDFKQVLEIINRILTDNDSRFDEIHRKRYVNGVTQETLILLEEDKSKSFVKKYFMSLMTCLENKPLYKLLLAEEFKLNDRNGKSIHYKFDFSKPKEAFYALTVKDGQYYILFNPHTRESYQWGQEPEFHIIGKEHLFKIAYSQYVNLRDTIVLTNRVEGLLYLQDKAVPCIALLNGELQFPLFFEKVILPMFPKRFLLIDLVKNAGEQKEIFEKNHSFQFIRTHGKNLFQFFRDDKEAFEKISAQFEYKEDFEHEGLQNPIVNISEY